MAEEQRIRASYKLFNHVAEVQNSQKIQAALKTAKIRNIFGLTGIGLVAVDACQRAYKLTKLDKDFVPISEAAYKGLLSQFQSGKGMNQSSTGSH